MSRRLSRSHDTSPPKAHKLAKMSKKTNVFGELLCKGEKPNEETEEEPTTSKKKKAAFKRLYQESYLNYGFVPTGDSHAPIPLCIICGNRLANDAMKSSKLLGHMETKHPGLTDKPLEFFEKKQRELYFLCTLYLFLCRWSFYFISSYLSPTP